MSNAILIKEVNNQPVIFNVDNVIDAARLEALQAVKMAEDLVASVFGENSQYADNTTCTVTDNPANPAFPYDVTFDASKIIKKTKRNTGTLSGIGMPGDKVINITPGTGVNYKYIAPFNGYLTINCAAQNSAGYISLYVENDKTDKKLYTVCHGPTGLSDYVPAKKGDPITINYRSATLIDCRFVLAEGEI